MCIFIYMVICINNFLLLSSTRQTEGLNFLAGGNSQGGFGRCTSCLPPAQPPVASSLLGAGIVGVCSALALQREGWRVTLIDRDAPGQGCSFGNAGILHSGGVLGLAPPAKLEEYMADARWASLETRRLLPKSDGLYLYIWTMTEANTKTTQTRSQRKVSRGRERQERG